MDWSVTPTLTLSQTYDSNFRFTNTPIPGTTKADYITSLTPIVSIIGETEETKFQFDTITAGQIYFQNPSYDTVNTNTNASLTESWSQRFSTTANFGFIHDYTLEDQLEASGIRADKIERYAFTPGLGGKYDLTETLNLSVSGSYSKVTYPSGLLPDYEVYQGTIAPVWAVTPRDNISLSTNFTYTSYQSQLQNSENGTTIKTISEMLGWERLLTEKLSVKVSGGYYYSMLDYMTQVAEFVPPFFIVLVNQPVSTTNGGYLFGADVKMNWSENFSTVFSAGNQEYNDVNARSFDSTFFSITAQYKISELTTLNLNARYNINSEISRGSEEIDYYIVNPSIERNLTENFVLRLSGSYEHEIDDYGTPTGTKSNYDRFRTWIDLTYKWPRFLASH